MSYLRLEKATDSERDLLGIIRATSWDKNLTSQEFCERNQKLYQHPYGKSNITTFVLKNLENKIVSSLDCLEVKLFFKDSHHGPTSVRNGFLIASVITPPQHRRKGYASVLLNRFFESQKWDLGILFSDIDPKFYEKWGFKLARRWVYELTSQAPKNQLTINPMDPALWIKKVFDFRKSKFDSEVGAQVAMAPEENFWDWQVERFRFFAQKRGGGPIPHVFYEVLTSHGPSFIAVAFNALTKKGEVLWRDSSNPESLTAIGQIVQSWGCETFSYWAKEGIGQKVHEENPMFWFKGAQTPALEGFYDPQLCDWW